MAALDFPSSGLVANVTTYTANNRTWIWNGVSWIGSNVIPDPTITLAGDLTGSATLTDLGDATLTATIAANSVALGTDTTGNYVASITNGSYITGGDGGGEGSAVTLAVDATSLNTASKVVARDASGNFSANIITATDFNATSDARLKVDVGVIDSRSVLQAINPVEFKWKETGKPSYGVIAQELEKVLPHLVVDREDGLKGVSYIPLIAVLVDAVKKLDARVKELESK